MEAVLGAISWRIVPTIDIGPISVSPHGLGIAVGYLLGGMLTARRAERLYNISRQHIWNALTWAVVGVIVGARLFFIVGHLGDYIPSDPLGIFRIWEGGIVFYGGVFGGIAAAIPYLRKNNISVLQALDAAAPGFPLGLIFGRIGDLVIGDHLGGPTTLPWGFRYAGGQLPGCPAPIDSGISCPVIGEVVHQTALYDLLSALLLLPVVLLLSRTRRVDGFLIMFTATWYAIARYVSDFARSAHLYAGFRGTQWVSLVLGISGIWFLARRARFGTISPPLPDDHPASVARASAAAAPEQAGARGPEEEGSPSVAHPEPDQAVAHSEVDQDVAHPEVDEVAVQPDELTND